MLGYPISVNIVPELDLRMNRKKPEGLQQ